MTTISINTSGLSSDMKPQVVQAINKIISDPILRPQINSQAETLTFQFEHKGLVTPEGKATARATASNETPNRTITFNLDRMGTEDGAVYFDLGSLTKKPFIDNAIHETFHIIYPDLTGLYHDGNPSDNNVTRGQEAAGEFAFRTFTTSTIMRMEHRPGSEEQDRLNEARIELNTNPTTRPDLSGVIWDSYNTPELMRAAVVDKTSIYSAHLLPKAQGKNYDQAPDSNDPWVNQEISEDGSSTQSVFDTGAEPWSSQTSQFDAYQRLQSQRVVFDTGSQQTKEFDNTNNRIWDERDIAFDPTSHVTNVQVKLNGENQTRSTANTVDYSAIGQIFGSAIGRAIVGKDGNPFVSLTAGTVAGFVGQKFVQALINGPDAIDLAQLDLAAFFNGKDVSLAGAGLGAASSFLAAELATSIGLDGIGQQMFASAAGGYLGSVLNQVRQQGFAVLTTGIDWNVALHASEVNISGTIGSLLAHQFVHPESQFGAVGGQLAGAVGSALAYSFSVGISAALNVFLPGVGAFFGTIIGTIIGDAIAGDPAHPKATNEIQVLDSDPNHFTNRPAGHDDGGNVVIAKEMGDQVTEIANSYLDTVHGAGIYYSGKVMIGYNAGAAPYQYITGWFPNGTEITPHFATATDAIQEGVRELLQNTEVFGGDLLVKRAHQAFMSGHHAAPTEVASDFTDLANLGGDIRTAQDYEQYLNDRETINALIELYPESAFTAGWAATFARVKELGLDQVNGSDFIGGVVGWLDSVNKAGLGAEAANATVKLNGTTVTVEIKIANGAEVPGALSVFADTISQTSDATGTTVRFVFNNGLAVTGFQFLAAGAPGTPGNDIMAGSAGDDTIHGGAGWDFIDGGAGSDHLFGEEGNDILRGGLGNDDLQGGQGDDSYVFNRGDGADTISDHYHTSVQDDPGTGPASNPTYTDRVVNAGTNSLVFGPGIARSDIALAQSGNDLIVYVKDPAHPGVPVAQLTDTIRLQGWFNPDGYDRIEKFVFADGPLDLSNGVLGPYLIPFGESLSRSSVVERSAVGAKVGTVSGFDFNPDATLSYSLLYPDGRFAINASTGVLSVAGTIDYDPTQSPQVMVRISDGAHVFDHTFTIGVIDIPNRARRDSAGGRDQGGPGSVDAGLQPVRRVRRRRRYAELHHLRQHHLERRRPLRAQRRRGAVRHRRNADRRAVRATQLRGRRGRLVQRPQRQGL